MPTARRIMFIILLMNIDLELCIEQWLELIIGGSLC